MHDNVVDLLDDLNDFFHTNVMCFKYAVLLFVCSLFIIAIPIFVSLQISLNVISVGVLIFIIASSMPGLLAMSEKVLPKYYCLLIIPLFTLGACLLLIKYNNTNPALFVDVNNFVNLISVPITSLILLCIALFISLCAKVNILRNVKTSALMLSIPFISVLMYIGHFAFDLFSFQPITDSFNMLTATSRDLSPLLVYFVLMTAALISFTLTTAFTLFVFSCIVYFIKTVFVLTFKAFWGDKPCDDIYFNALAAGAFLCYYWIKKMSEYDLFIPYLDIAFAYFMPY